MEIQGNLLAKVIKGISSEPQAFLICNLVEKEIKKMELADYIWPISFKKGNLTLGAIDGFYIALFRTQELIFLHSLNEKLSDKKVNKIFYRFSAKKQNNF